MYIFYFGHYNFDMWAHLSNCISPHAYSRSLGQYILTIFGHHAHQSWPDQSGQNGKFMFWLKLADTLLVGESDWIMILNRWFWWYIMHIIVKVTRAIFETAQGHSGTTGTTAHGLYSMDSWHLIEDLVHCSNQHPCGPFYSSLVTITMTPNDPGLWLHMTHGHKYQLRVSTI